jgi:hypothetical protein
MSDPVELIVLNRLVFCILACCLMRGLWPSKFTYLIDNKQL